MAASESENLRAHDTESRLWDRALVLVVALAGCAVWAWFAWRTRISLEDGYITFRYARNLAEGNGFVYNLGEHVLGTTTPLQTMILAALGLVFGPRHIPLIASILMPPFGIAAGLLGYAALVRLGVPRTGAAAGLLLFYLRRLVIQTSLGGMETPLALFLMALGLYFVSKRQSVAATISVALLALCRVDGLVWGGLLLAVTLLSDYRKPLRQAIALGVVVIPWVAFASFYFGSPIPNTVLAKGVVRPGREGLLLDPGHLDRFGRWYVSGTGLAADHPLFPIWIALLALGVYAVCRTRRLELALLPVFPVVYAVAMYLGRAPMYRWYLVPMVFSCTLLAGVAVGQMVSWAAKAKPNWMPRAARVVGAALAILCIVGLALVLRVELTHLKRFQENEVGLRQRVGLWLHANTPPDASVAMEAIGYQGYFSQRRIIDMAGLVTPRVVAYKARFASNGTIFKHILRELKPDYIVLRSFEVDRNRHFNGGKLFRTAQDREWFFQHYREARRFVAPHPEIGPRLTHLTIYERMQPSAPGAAGANRPGDAPIPSPVSRPATGFRL